MDKKNILILGASSGVGESLVKLLSPAEFNIYTASRRDISEPNTVTHYKVDISNYSDIEAVFKKLHSQNIKLNYLINCVGVGFYAPLTEDYSQYWQKILGTNVLGLSNILSLSLQYRIPTDHFVHLGSLAAYRISQTPGNLIYSASKTAALPLLSGYRKEIKASLKDIKVSFISPGFIEGTDFGKNFFVSSPENKTDLYSKFQGLKPMDIAENILYVLKSPPHVEISEMSIRPKDQPD